MELGKYRLIPKGTLVWSIALQESVRFDKDMIVQLTNGIINHQDAYFGTLQMLLFNMPGQIPTLLPKHNGEVGPFTLKETRHYSVPQPQFFSYTYKTKKDDTTKTNNSRPPTSYDTKKHKSKRLT